MEGYYPTSLGEVEGWARARNIAPDAARRRFMQFCVLEAVASDERLSRIAVLRGSGALQLVYGGPRDCDDVDLIVLNIDGGPIGGDHPDAPKQRLNRALGERLTFHFGGDDAWWEWFKLVKVQLSQAECVYDVRRVVLCEDAASSAAGRSINVATLEVLVAEKLTAMAHAVFRSRTRHREQDVFDIASLAQRGVGFDERRVAELVRRRALQHRFEFRREHFDDRGRAYIGASYERLRQWVGKASFIEFEPAWARVLALVDRILEIQRALPPVEPEALLRAEERSQPRPKVSYILPLHLFAAAEHTRSLGGHPE